MAGSTADKFTATRNAARPNSARVTSGRTSGVFSLSCDNLAGWPVTGVSAVHFVTYQINTSDEIVAGTQQDWLGLVSGNNIGSMVLKDGTDNGNVIGDVVEMLPTAAWGQGFDDGLAVGHNRDGTHKASLPLTTPQITTSINDSGGNEVIKTPATASAVNELTITNAATAGSPKAAATGGDTNINFLLDGKGTGMVAARMATPQGYLVNGKVSATVASNNLTVAIKTIQGNNPSAADPVYVRIGDTVRTLTSALSITKNAGTNWFSKGASYFAANESDYFVYLVWNTTDSAVTIAFSSDPSMRIYSDFSTTNTNWNYFAGSGSAPAATNEVELVGRFNATLGVSASFNWSIPATVIVINRPIFETRTFSATNSGTAGGTISWKQAFNEKRVYGTTAVLTLTAASQITGTVVFPTGFFLNTPFAIASGGEHGTTTLQMGSINSAVANTGMTVQNTGTNGSTSGTLKVYYQVTGS